MFCQYVVITTATGYLIFFMIEIDYESNMIIDDSFAELLVVIKCYTTLWNANHKSAKTLFK